MESFKLYIEKNHKRNLFEGSDLTFSSSKDNILIQLADFITGTIGRIYDENKNDEHENIYLQLLGKNTASIRFYPVEYKPSNFLKELDEGNRFDRDIAVLCNNLALDYIDKNKGESKDDIDKINFLRLMLLYQKAYGLDRYFSTKAFLNHLNIQRDGSMSEHYFRTRIVGRLRDAGILIASSSRGNKSGYKLPTSLSDIHDYLQHGHNQIVPMLARIKICRNQIKLATHNELDILDHAQLSNLKGMIE
jgi:hypothetical protein